MKQSQYREQGMRLLAVPKRRQMMLPLLGIFMLGFVIVLVGIAVSMGAWEEAGSIMLFCVGLAVIIFVAGLFTGYCLKARHIWYDEEKLLIGRPFRQYETVQWRGIVRMQILNQDFFYLYDRDGRRLVSADAGMTGYHEFYDMAAKHCMPERDVMAGTGTPYQEKYVAASGGGVLRYRTGEYAVMLVISLLLAGMVFGVEFASGKNADGILAWCLSAENMEAKLIILALIAGSAAALIYTGLQKITYDQRQIEICRFPRGVVRMNWNEVRKTECRREESGYRTLILYTDRKNYVIREKQFRKGFSELIRSIGA